MQLYRLLWIYVAVHELGGTGPGKSSKQHWTGDEWHEAAVAIAQGPTPLLVAGGELDIDQIEAGEGQISCIAMTALHKETFNGRRVQCLDRYRSQTAI